MSATRGGAPQRCVAVVRAASRRASHVDHVFGTGLGGGKVDVCRPGDEVEVASQSAW